MLIFSFRLRVLIQWKKIMIILLLILIVEWPIAILQIASHLIKASWNIINIEKSSSVKCEIHLPIWGAFAPVEIGILIYTNFKTMYSNINILSYIKIIIIINILNLRCNASITKAIKIKHLKINYNFIQ